MNLGRVLKGLGLVVLMTGLSVGSAMAADWSKL